MSGICDANRRRVVTVIRQDRYFCSMRAQGGSDGVNTCMTLVCDHTSRNRDDSVPMFVQLCIKLGDVTGNAPFVWRCGCDTCGALYLIGGNCVAVFRNRYRPAG